MTLSELFQLLELDLLQSYRVGRVHGKRTVQKSVFRRLQSLLLALVIAISIAGITYFIGGLMGWSLLSPLIASNLNIGASLFNAILLFTVIGSIMFSATTVGNSKKMEYMMVMPIPLRVLFIEKTIIMIVVSSLIWLIIGTPILVGLAVLSGSPLALLSPLAFVVLILLLVSISVPIGGLLGLFFARVVAGRRRLKQVGYFLMTALAVTFSILWYYVLYLDNTETVLFEWLFALSSQLGLTSELTPGYLVSRVSLGLLVGAPLSLWEIVTILLLVCAAVAINQFNGIVCERAHYSGWLAVESLRGGKRPLRGHLRWAPSSIPLARLSTTTTVSIWYNITSLRRDARVLSNYLLGPFRYVIIILIPLMTPVTTRPSFVIPFALVATLSLICISYALYFAGYETVYEGSNIMNLQLAAANMADYLKGKVYSPLLFSTIVGVCGCVLVIFLEPMFWIVAPLVIIWCISTTLMAGGIAVSAAVTSGDFKSSRMILRQRGTAVQLPIRGWGALKAQLLPMLISLIAVILMLSLWFFDNLLLSYVILAIYSVFCLRLAGHYCYSAGVKLAQIECTEYL